MPRGDSRRVARAPELPRLYAILDLDCLSPIVSTSATEAFAAQSATNLTDPLAGSGRPASSIPNEQELLESVLNFAAELHAGGATWLQYRAKRLPVRCALSHARALRKQFPELKLIMNDRADLCLAAQFDGAHVGQDDLPPEAVRRLVGDRVLGVSTHNPEQVREAASTSADYVAIGPVFSTGSKLNPDPVVGLEGVRRARELTGKPLVAIGGITLANCREVIAAGADAVAIIGGLVKSPRKSAEEFLRVL